MNMKPKDLRTLRRDFDARYEVNYPPPTATAKDDGQTSNIVLIIWGIVSLAGAIISLPHTVNAVLSGVTEMHEVLKYGYAVAVFIGVELALIMVAFTSAHRQLDNPKPKPVITIATILASILFRLGVRHRPTPPTSDEAQGVGGLLVMLLLSALLFNLADTTKNQQLLDLTKFVSGLIAPALLFLAGHEFAHHLAGKLLAGKIAQSEHDKRLEAWRAERNEAWRAYVETIEEKEVANAQTTPLPKSRSGNIPPEHEKGEENITQKRNAHTLKEYPIVNQRDGQMELLLTSSE